MILKQSSKNRLFIHYTLYIYAFFFVPLQQQSFKQLEQCTKMYLITLYETQCLR